MTIQILNNTQIATPLAFVSPATFKEQILAWKPTSKNALEHSDIGELLCSSTKPKTWKETISAAMA